MKIKHLPKKTCQFFVAAKFNPHDELEKARNPQGQSLLTYTTQHGTLEILKQLIEAKMDLNQEESTQKRLSALSSAILFDKHEMVDLILAQKKIKVDIKCEHNMTPLIIACVRGHLGTVKKLLDMKAEVNFQNDFGETALITAANYNHLEIVKTLVTDYKANIHLKATLGQTALVHATMKGFKQMAKFLIQQGATLENTGIQISGEGEVLEDTTTPIPYQLLTAASPNPQKMNESLGKTLALELCKAAPENDTDRILELIKLGADVNQAHKFEDKQATPLHFACRYGQKEAAKLLVEQGADLNAQSTTGKTPLELVTHSKKKFKTLLENTQTASDQRLMSKFSDETTQVIVFKEKAPEDSVVEKKAINTKHST